MHAAIGARPVAGFRSSDGLDSKSQRSLFAEAIERALLGADEQAAAADGGRARHFGVELDLLQLRAFFQIDDIEILVLGANKNSISDHHRRAFDLALRGERPDQLARFPVPSIDALIAA